MKKLTGSLGLSFLALSLLAAGCASATSGDEATAEDQSDVRVAACPATVALRFGKPKVAARTPAPFDGSEFSAPEKARVESVMAATRNLSSVETKLTLDRTSSGRCFYKGAGEERATFRTKGGKDIFQIFEPGGLQVFAFPSSYDANGLVFAPNSSATLMANVGASGAFSDGATRSVKIGRVAFADPAKGATVLQSGTNDAIFDGPERVTFIAKAPNVTAFVATTFLAECTILKEESSATETRIEVGIEYELDDGFNGCSIEFSNDAGYSADINVGLSIDD